MDLTGRYFLEALRLKGGPLRRPGRKTVQMLAPEGLYLKSVPQIACLPCVSITAAAVAEQ